MFIRCQVPPSLYIGNPEAAEYSAPFVTLNCATQCEDVVACNISQPFEAPTGRGAKKDSGLEIKSGDHCEKKEVEITLGRLKLDEDMELGYITQWSEEIGWDKLNDLKECPLLTSCCNLGRWKYAASLPPCHRNRPCAAICVATS